MAHVTYPNESAEYRQARSALLGAEMALRRQIEAVAAQRRAFPPGGEVPEDYAFERIGEDGMPESVNLSKLFGPHDTLILYSHSEARLPGGLGSGRDGSRRRLSKRAARAV